MKKILLIAAGLILLTLFGGVTMLAAFQVVQNCEEFVAESTVEESNNQSTDGENQLAGQPVGDEAVMEQCLYGDNPSPPVGSGGPFIQPPANGQNGRLLDSVLEIVSTHGDYACKITTLNGAAGAWHQLIVAATADGVDIEGGWCYRTYADQKRAWDSRRCYIPGNCDGSPYPPTARPGHSNHGWGLAVDVWNAWDSILSCSDPEFRWLESNGPSFGWVHPDWTRCGRSSQEPWHWEYVG